MVVGGDSGEGELDFEELVAGGTPTAPGIDVDGRDVCALMYTSGTTGRPKGVMLTHDNLMWNIVNLLSVGRGLREGDKTVTVAPMFHACGLGVHTLPLIYIGGTSTIMAAFDPRATLAAMARERVTVQFLVPAMWAALMAVPDFEEYDLSALELAVTGAAPCPLPVLEYFEGRGVPVSGGFRLTETAPGATLLDAGHIKEKLGSITPIAVVALTEDGVAAADELIAHVRERLAHFKCSTRVEFVPGLPRTATGKVLKATLRMNYGGREVPLGR